MCTTLSSKQHPEELGGGGTMGPFPSQRRMALNGCGEMGLEVNSPGWKVILSKAWLKKLGWKSPFKQVR